MKKTIIVFDGYCILCSNFVSFITKLDKDDEFRFTTFESKFISNNYPKISLQDTVFVIDPSENILTKSNAVIFCLKKIKKLYIISILLRIFPVIFLDFVYGLVSRYRYKLFGKKLECSYPNKILKSKILS
tara:strand:+ start:460 stop:849 length:390 start_codon:yes stop_codon:yes gene_type:complete